MSYVIPIKTALFTFPMIAFLFTIPFILHQYHKYGSIHKLRVLIVYSFILYMMTVYFLVILPLPKISEVVNPISDMIQLQPFAFIQDFLKETSLIITNPNTYLKAVREPCFYTVIFNIFMTMPFGMYLRYYFKCSLKKVIIYSFLLSLFFELTQLTGLYFIYPSPYRLFDVDDLLMNTIGGILGYLIMGCFRRVLPTRDKIDEDSRKEGEKVSGLRRITVFCLDSIIYLLMLSICLSIFNFQYTKYIAFFFYYGFLPWVLKGRTLGSKFLNVKFQYPNLTGIRNLLRMMFLYFYYYYLPYLLILILISISSFLGLPVAQNILLCILFVFSIFLLYFISLLRILTKRKSYYDRFFHVQFESVIKTDQESSSQ